MPFDVNKYKLEEEKEEKQEEKDNDYDNIFTMLLKIFTLKIRSKEEAVNASNTLVEYNTRILSLIFGYDFVYNLITGKEPYWGYIIIIFIGILTYCFYKWKSRIATIIYFLLLILFFLSLITMLIENSFKSQWIYEALFIIPMFSISWKMLKSSFLIHKKEENITQNVIENKPSNLNLKNGFKRILLALGYLLFIFIGLIIGFSTSSLAAIIGAIIGFFVFKYTLIGINWIIEGFKND